MLNVWTICWGDKYDPEYVPRLARMVERNVSVPFRFRCITDLEFPTVETIKPVCDYPGWWQKIQLFKPGFCVGQNLWLDLDVVVIDSLDWAARLEGFHVTKNWALSGHGGVQSSVMVWQEVPQIWERFERDAIDRLWGDQEFITELWERDEIALDWIEEKRVKSYRYHCRQGPPPGCSVVCFHGKPDPHEVADAWVRESMSTSV